jgi:hypothetical protein
LNKGQERYQFVHTQDQYPLPSPELWVLDGTCKNDFLNPC